MPDRLSPMRGAPARLKILWGNKFGFFAYYCWAVGALTLVLTLLQG